MGEGRGSISWVPCQVASQVPGGCGRRCRHCCCHCCCVGFATQNRRKSITHPRVYAAVAIVVAIVVAPDFDPKPSQKRYTPTRLRHCRHCCCHCCCDLKSVAEALQIHAFTALSPLLLPRICAPDPQPRTPASDPSTSDPQPHTLNPRPSIPGAAAWASTHSIYSCLLKYIPKHNI